MKTPPPEELDALREEIRALPAGRPCASVRQIKARLHCSQRTAEATLKRLEGEKLLSRRPDGRYCAGVASGAPQKAAGPAALGEGQPKYQAMAADLRYRIEQREYAPGAPLPSEAALCRHYGVSRITVRAALERLSREGMIERAPGQGTFVRQGAAVPAVRALKIVCRPDHGGLANDAFLTELLDEAHRQTALRGWALQAVAVNDGDAFAGMAARDPSLLGDGAAVVFVSYDVQPADAALLAARRVPAAVIGPRERAGGLPFVNGDHESGGDIAVRYLYELGYRAIAFACGPKGYDMAERLLAGYRKGLEGCGLPQRPELLTAPTAWSREEGAAAAEELLSRPLRPDALIVYGDWALYGTMEVLRRHGVCVPRDMALLHLGSCQWLDKALQLRLTQVYEPHSSMIGRALGLIDGAIAGDRVAYGIFNPYSLRIGASCGLGAAALKTEEKT